jgi:hypothetical protein
VLRLEMGRAIWTVVAAGLVGVSSFGCGSAGSSEIASSQMALISVRETGSSSASASLPKAPRAFADTTYAQLATDGEQRLWLLETGYRGGHLRLALHEGGSGAWRPVKPPPQLPSDAAAVKVAAAPGTLTPQPCLAFTEAKTGHPVITCHGLRKWFPQSVGHLVAAGSRLVDLATIRGRLVALFVGRVSRRSSELQVIQTNPGGGHLERAGPPLRIGSVLAQLGDGTHERGDPQVEVAIESQRAKPTRYVMRLENHRWVRGGPVLRGPGLGPLVSGSVRVGPTTYMPVIDAEVEPWTFSVYSSSGGSRWIPGPPTKGFGDAQGRLDFAAGAIWASWQEDRELKAGGFEAVNRVARLGTGGERLDEQKLWQGRVVGPGNTQVLAFRDQLLTLFMRGGQNGKLVTSVVSLNIEA